MSEKRQITIRLTTLILIVILIIVAIVVAVKVIKKDNKIEENNEIEHQNVNPNEIPEENLTPNIDESTDFELSFLKIENNKSNMIYSPLSIKYALNMLNEGAAGETKKQIEKVIGDLDLTTYDNISKRLSLANGLYIRETYSDLVKDEYIETLEDKYNAEVKYDSFKNAKNINKWIEDKTMGQIDNMLEDEQINDPDVKMALINALTIDMEWEEDFDTSSTYGSEFNLADGSKMQATMMHKKTSGDSASYYKDENVTALAINLEEYDDVQLEFLAIMPKDNLAKYIENVTLEEINDIIDELTLASEEKAGINISIPKFSFDYELNLNRDLKALGITEAFIRRYSRFYRNC